MSVIVDFDMRKNENFEKFFIIDLFDNEIVKSATFKIN